MKAKIVGIVLLLAVVCFGLALAYGLYTNKKERDAVKKNYGSTVAEMCKPPAGGVADQANMPTGTRPFQAVVLKQGDSLRHSWHKDLPDAYRAENKDTLDLVVCVKERTETVEKCEYTTSSDTKNGKVAFTVNRKQHFADLVLLNATTGNRIAELTVEGGTPSGCPSTAHSNDPDVTGKKVSYNDFLIAVEPYLKE